MRKIVAIFVLCVFAAAHGVSAEQSLFASLYPAETHTTTFASASGTAAAESQPDAHLVPPGQAYLTAEPEECCESSVSSKSALTHCTVDCMVALAPFGPDFQKSTQSTGSAMETLHSALPPATLFRPPIG